MSTYSIAQYIAAVAPALSRDGSQAVFIAMAQERTNKPFWGLKYNQAVALLAAHIWYRLGAGSSMVPGSGSSESGSVGTVVSKREGDLAISYGAISSSSSSSADADLQTTRWGLMLLALRKGCRPFYGVTGDIGSRVLGPCVPGDAV